MNSFTKSVFTFCVVFALVTLTGSPRARAAVIWGGGINQPWESGPNWIGNQAPIATDSATLNSGHATITSEVTVDNLMINNSAQVSLTPEHRELNVNSFSIDAANGAKLELNDSCMIVHYTGTVPNAQAAALILSGYNDGVGILNTSAYTNDGYLLGILDNADYQYSNFPDATLIIASVVPGDVNMDGIVSMTDYDVVTDHMGLTPAYWYQGDADLNGQITQDDYAVIDAYLGVSGPTCVPEPTAAMGLIASCTAAVAMRRRRHLA
jgi:hypothetical protein